MVNFWATKAFPGKNNNKKNNKEEKWADISDDYIFAAVEISSRVSSRNLSKPRQDF